MLVSFIINTRHLESELQLTNNNNNEKLVIIWFLRYSADFMTWGCSLLRWNFPSRIQKNMLVKETETQIVLKSQSVNIFLVLICKRDEGTLCVRVKGSQVKNSRNDIPLITLTIGRIHFQELFSVVLWLMNYRSKRKRTCSPETA